MGSYLVRLLREEGQEVLIARTDEEAFEVIERESPAFVFADVRLQQSRLDGIGIVNRIRQEWPRVVSCVVSGYIDQRPYRERVEELNTRVLRKPYKAEELRGLFRGMRADAMSGSSVHTQRLFRIAEENHVPIEVTMRLLEAASRMHDEGQPMEQERSEGREVAGGPVVVWGTDPYRVVQVGAVVVGFAGALTLPIWWSFGITVVSPIIALASVVGAPIFWLMAKMGQRQSESRR